MSTDIIGIPTIYVDADSCPVKAEIVEIASTVAVPVVFVASYNHHSNEKDTYTSWKYVDSGKEAADLFIMNHDKREDIVITHDIGLASTLLPKEIQTSSPKGFLFEEKDIQTALDIRFLKAKARKRGM
ncbi:DUF188 domain-containing protein [Neobacillus niacini]|uniref:DUF188 domain-containing protein n=1 Tax=Neobacillus niacini TaxID=86668 RepID=UPI00288B9B4F|nr:DUF188 domain-containing protein [Neobacillus niacini]